MHTVTSKDSTRVAYWESGKGPPLVLVHGTAADHTRWAPILTQLQERFTVFAMDRRGRGGSGDAADYAVLWSVIDSEDGGGPGVEPTVRFWADSSRSTSSGARKNLRRPATATRFSG